LNTIKALFGDKADEVVLYLIEAIKDPLLRAIMYTRVSEYKEQHKTGTIKPGIRQSLKKPDAPLEIRNCEA
jgi:hypothetical protein